MIEANELKEKRKEVEQRQKLQEQEELNELSKAALWSWPMSCTERRR